MPISPQDVPPQRRGETSARLRPRFSEVVRHDMLILTTLATAVGGVTGGAVIAFRETIDLVQLLAYGTSTERLILFIDTLPWWHVLAAPTVGGLVIGILVWLLMPDKRPEGVADVIAASALTAGRMRFRRGLAAALINAASIGVGASVGREGPAVHLGATLGSCLAERLQLSRTLARTLLGCGVAAAVAASFNAPIAGALFANEVVIGHYALRAFAPVVVASVVGTIISRTYFGHFPAFAVTAHQIASLWEFLGFFVLGILAGLVAMAFVSATRLANDAAGRLPVPPWLRPMIGGLLVGIIALAFPQVLGIGYGFTEHVLTQSMAIPLLVGVLVAKLVATAISLGFGFGGGVFSPSLVIGAALGGAYGQIASNLFQGLSGSDAYAIVGMGAVAAAVLGAPISTSLIVFEMTGDYEITVAVMLAVVVGTLLSRPLRGRSFFTWQLEQRGLDLHGGFQTALLRSIRIRDVVSRLCEVIGPGIDLKALRFMLQNSPDGQLFVVDDEGRLVGTVTLADLSDAAFDDTRMEVFNVSDVTRTKPPILDLDDDLETALKLMQATGEPHVAVVEDREGRVFAGCLHERDALTAYTRALLEIRREERT